MTKEQLLKEVEKSSFKLDRIETFLLRDNIYIFRIDKEKESNVWQSWFWTGDKFNSNRAFVIRLPGALLVDSLLINFSYVRPVRSL